jgi:diguanylate cyclase (GGDEF)-like protein
VHKAPLSTVAPAEVLHPLTGLPNTIKTTITAERRKRASEGAIALQAILSKNKEIEEAHIDVLTGLPDRAIFEQDIRSVAERERGNPNPSAVFSIIDLNGVKRVNEARGHREGGDPYIVASANAIKRTLRPGDKAFRLGGDEFGVIRYDAPDNLDELNDRVRQAVINEPGLTDLSLPPRLYTGLSIGTRRFAAGDTADSWIAAADTLLMEDKASFNATIPREVLSQDSRLV